MILATRRSTRRPSRTRLAAIASALVLFPLTSATVHAGPTDAVRAASERVARAVGAPLAVTVKRGTGRASFVRRADRGDLNPRSARRNPVVTAEDFVVQHGDLFGLHDGAAELAAPTAAVDRLGRTHVSWRQRHDGIEVFGGILRAHLTADGALESVNGAVAPIVGPLAVTPTIAADDADRRALAGARGEPTTIVARRLVIYDPSLLRDVASDPRLAYAVELETVASGRRDLALIDALDGRLLDRIARTPDALTRQVSQNILANVVWSEGDPDPIPAAWSGGSVAQVAGWQDEIDGARESYDFHGSLTLGTYLGYDGADAPMLARHDPPGLACPNASWNGETTNFCPDVTSDDVVSHEWGHAYTQFTADLVYAWQSGALNESYSDVWGETVDLLNGRQTDTPGGPRAADGSACSTIGTFDDDFPATDATLRWLVSEDSSGFGGAIRDMWHPECRFDPGRVSSSSYQCAGGDGGGVHTNSGVPNHLYALLVDGGTYNGETVAPLGITKAASILWRALSVYETPVTDFSDHADALEASCADLVGATLGEPVTTAPGTWTASAETIAAADCDAVAAAIAAVELRDAPPCLIVPILQPNPPALCDGAGVFEPLSVSDFESGLAPWTAGTRGVVDPMTYDGGTWTQTTALPDGRAGAAAFTADPILGDCELDDETGVSFLESPDFVAPADRAVLRVAFAHWIASEPGYDGGNVKVSVNGGPFEVVPADRFTFNAYNRTLNVTNNTCPLAGEPAWSGTDSGGFGGSWGESQLDLVDFVEPGDTVKLRFEFGMDACNGNTGWYVDDVRVYTCSDDIPLCPVTPIPGCKQTPVGRSQLTIKDNQTDTKDRLQWSWKGGAATSFGDLGNPVATTRYSLCIWDGRSGTPTLVTHADVAAGTGWSTNGSTRVAYKDSHATQDGVTKIYVKVGAAGKAQASLQAKGIEIPIPGAASLSHRFEANPNVTVQLVSATGACWQSTFTTPDFRTNTLPKTQASHRGL